MRIENQSGTYLVKKIEDDLVCLENEQNTEMKIRIPSFQLPQPILVGDMLYLQVNNGILEDAFIKSNN